MDETTEAEEILEALAMSIENAASKDFTIRATKESYSGTKLAVVTTTRNMLIH